MRRLGFEPVRATRRGGGACVWRRRRADAPPPFDLILMDLQDARPRRLRGDPPPAPAGAAAGARPTPIVALTADGLDEERRACEAAGFDAFLVKPFEFDDLAAAIDRVCRPRRRGGGRLSRAS